MGRLNRIWFRKDIGWWMVTLGGEKIRLAQGRANKKLADQKFHELAALRLTAPDSPAARVADIIEKFLASNRPHLSAETMRNYDWYGQAFAEHSGFLLVTEVKPHHVTDFVSKEGWGETTQYNARRSLFRVFHWAEEEGLIPKNPLKGMKRGKPAPRNRAMKESEFRSLLKGEPKKRFKTFLYALWATGCRPKEARTLKWEQVREDRWVLTEHKTFHRTKKPRVIYLNTPMQRLMRVLHRESKSEFVFINMYGKPWTLNAVRLRMHRLKKKLGLPEDLCTYLIRHAFGTNAIVNGVDVATVAELMGHTSLEMVSSVYLHLADQHKHLQDAIAKATGRRVPSKPPRDETRSVA